MRLRRSPRSGGPYVRAPGGPRGARGAQGARGGTGGAGAPGFSRAFPGPPLAAELAQAGGVVEQRAAAAERLAQLHAALGDTAAAEEQAALAAAARAEAAEKAAKEAREREEREKKESEDQSMAAVGGDEAAAEAPGVGDGDRD